MDLRVERTYRLLIDSFTDLMEARTYEEISVAALCDAAMIRRTTFYKHFADKDEFFAFYLKTLRDEFEERTRAKVSREGKMTAQERQVHMLTETVAFLTAHEKLVDNVMSSSASHQLVETMGEIIARDTLIALDAQPEIAQRLNTSNNALAQFVSSGMLGALQDWWRRGHEESEFDDISNVLESFGRLLG